MRHSQFYKERPWYCLCLAFVLFAVGAEFFAKQHAASAAVTMAQGVSKNPPANYRAQAKHHARLSGIASVIGLALAILFTVIWYVSFVKAESALQSIPIIFGAIYLALFVTMV